MDLFKILPTGLVLLAPKKQLIILIVEISSSKSAFMDLGGKRMDCTVSCLMCVGISYVSSRRMD